jgi:GT2 family glycosyltransferase
MTMQDLSVIIPFHKNLDHLGRCLAALQASPGWAELVVVADGAIDDCRELAASYGARVISILGPNGPAVARNIGAASAIGDVLVFVDADVVVAPDAIGRLGRLMSMRPDLDAVFGAYDEQPAEKNFVSQYKNLAHAYIHRSSKTVVHTFWAGFGAVRREAFERVGGFDERFARPSVEDIELGYRLSAAGCRVELHHELVGCHLKRWTVRSLIASDLFDRGIPWTQLILGFGRLSNDLNIRTAYRACVVLAYVLLMLAGAAIVWPEALLAAPFLIAVLVYLSRSYYAYFLEQRGVWFALRVLPLHYLYHLYNGVSFAAGTAIYLAQVRLGLELPGAVPLGGWTRVNASAPVALNTMLPGLRPSEFESVRSSHPAVGT